MLAKCYRFSSLRKLATNRREFPSVFMGENRGAQVLEPAGRRRRNSSVPEEPVDLLDVLLRPDVAPVPLIGGFLQHGSHVLQACADPGAFQRFSVERSAQGSQL